MRLLSEPKISLNSNPRAPLAALVDIIVDEPVSVDIDVNCGDRSRTLHYPFTDALQRQPPIVGLYLDGQHTVGLGFFNSAGHQCGVPVQLSLQAPSLPLGAHDFPYFRVVKNDPKRREPGWTLLSVHRNPTGRYQDWTEAQREFAYGWAIILALDRDGDVIGYYQSDTIIEGIDRLSNGNLFFHRWDFCTHEIDWLGNPIQKCGHNPRLTKENTIVYFDNGTWGARQPNLSIRPEHNFSRAVECRVNEKQETVEEVWSSYWYDRDSAWHAPDVSDAHRLPATGNMLVRWAYCLSPQSGQTYDSYELGKTFFNSLPNPSRLREYCSKKMTSYSNYICMTRTMFCNGVCTEGL